MKRPLVILLLVVLAGVLGAQGPASPRAAATSAPARFITCDILIDSGTSPLAAWQIDFRAAIAGGSVELVGVEGGVPGAYAQPAFYDPEALTHDHVVLAAFSTAKPDALPSGKTRVARLHLRVLGNAGAHPETHIKLMAAADAGGHTIEPAVSASLGDTP